MGFQGPPTPVGKRPCHNGPCGFKNLANLCLTELDRFKVEGKNQFFRSYFATHGVARLLRFYFTTRVLYRNHKVPGQQGSAALEILKIIESLSMVVQKFFSCRRRNNIPIQTLFQWNIFGLTLSRQVLIETLISSIRLNKLTTID